LCEQLATRYDTIWCREYAREYLERQGGIYTYDDLVTIAKGQLRLEEQAVEKARNGLVFIDTDMYVMKIWSEFVYGKCDSWILDQIERRTYDLYLLCNIDLPWQEDPLREYPDLAIRQELYDIYKDSLTNQPVPWTVITGQKEERLGQAVEAIDDLRFTICDL
jgi:nicotinamide riboside kinase